MSDPSDAPTGPFLKGRGAQYNPANPYHRFAYETDPGFVEDQATTYIEVHPKTILNKVNSPENLPLQRFWKKPCANRGWNMSLSCLPETRTFTNRRNGNLALPAKSWRSS